MSDIRNKPISQWTIEDLNMVVSEEWEESIELELKEGLPLKSGSHGWAQKKKFHDSERDGIAKEIVALANTRGGHVIIGIKESTDTPKRAAELGEKLPHINDLVDRLRQCLHNHIDPPLLGLEINVIKEDDEDKGYIVIKVPPSQTPPHGFGKPAKAYRRVDDRSEPMTMRDMQNAFWDGRMRRERIANLRLEKRESLADLDAPDKHFAYRMSLITTQSAYIDELLDRLQNREIRLNTLFRTDTPSLGERNLENQYEWQPHVNGIINEHARAEGIHRVERWEIDETGVITVLGHHSGSTHGSDVPHLHWKWILGSVANLFLVARSLEIVSGFGRQTWEYDAEFHSGDPDMVIFLGDQVHGSYQSVSSGSQLLRPIIVNDLLSEKDLERVEKKVASCFRMKRLGVSTLKEIVDTVSW